MSKRMQLAQLLPTHGLGLVADPACNHEEDRARSVFFKDRQGRGVLGKVAVIKGDLRHVISMFARILKPGRQPNMLFKKVNRTAIGIRPRIPRELMVDKVPAGRCGRSYSGG